MPVYCPPLVRGHGDKLSGQPVRRPSQRPAASCSIVWRRRRGNWRTMSVARRRSRGARVFETFPAQASAGAGQLLRVLQQRETAFRKRLITPGKTDHSPSLAGTQRSSAVAAGDQPALDRARAAAARPRRRTPSARPHLRDGVRPRRGPRHAPEHLAMILRGTLGTRWSRRCGRGVPG